MATHPLTKVTNWYVDHLQRNRREWIAAFICAFGFWDRSLGHWNLLLLVLAVLGAKASRLPLVKAAAFDFMNWSLDHIEAASRRRAIRAGTHGMIKRFPPNRADLDQYLLGRITLKDQDQRPLYDLKILAHPESNTPAMVLPGKVRVGIVTMNIADIAHSLNELAVLDIDADHRVEIRVSDVDPYAFRVGGETLVIDLASGQAAILEYTASIAYRTAEPEHVGLIRAAIETIAEAPIREAAHKVLAGVDNGASAVKALRKRFAQLLHPDRSSSSSASNALGLINAALDKAEA